MKRGRRRKCLCIKRVLYPEGGPSGPDAVQLGRPSAGPVTGISSAVTRRHSGGTFFADVRLLFTRDFNSWKVTWNVTCLYAVVAAELS
jgi:hypothetical protein